MKIRVDEQYFACIAQMRLTAADGAAWSAFLCENPAKTAEAIEMPFGGGLARAWRTIYTCTYMEDQIPVG